MSALSAPAALREQRGLRVAHLRARDVLGVHAAGKILGWPRIEASIIGWLLQTKALIMIIFVNVLLDKQIITNETFTALLLMAVASTMLTVPMVAPKLAPMRELILRSR